MYHGPQGKDLSLPGSFQDEVQQPSAVQYICSGERSGQGDSGGGWPERNSDGDTPAQQYGEAGRAGLFRTPPQPSVFFHIFPSSS